MKPSVQVARRLKGFDAPTVWGEFTPLAIQNKAVNLGQVRQYLNESNDCVW
jgi:hypothetical protein